MYYQCHLQQGNSHTTRWIEARAAKVGAKVEVLPTHEWWEVVKVFAHAIGEDMLKEHQRMHRASLPSVEPMA